MERTELSKRNPYYISKHRMYELRHFCRQYPEWRKELASLTHVIGVQMDRPNVKEDRTGSAVEKLVELRDLYLAKMDLIEQAALKTDPVIGRYIFEAVTEGLSYDKLRARGKVYCNKSMYYDYYHKFFWILSNSQILQVL